MLGVFICNVFDLFFFGVMKYVKIYMYLYIERGMIYGIFLYVSEDMDFGV